jgi:putative transposase
MHCGKPTEGAWPVMKNGLGNLAAGTTGQLAAAMRYQLDRIQRQPDLITGFPGQTGLTVEPEPPRDPGRGISAL